MTPIVTQALTGKLRPEAAVKARRLGGRTWYLWSLFTMLNDARMKKCGKFVLYADAPAAQGSPEACGIAATFARR